jgi:hypothetical protein
MADKKKTNAITAAHLSKTGARGKEIDAIIREQVTIIDDKLQHAPRAWGRNVVLHDLPQTFPIPGLEKIDTQRIVYSALLRNYDSRGFETKIVLDDTTTLCLAWMTDLDTEEVEAMNATIRAMRIPRSNMNAFIKQASSAPRSALAVREGFGAPARPINIRPDDREMPPRGGLQPRHADQASDALASAEKAILDDLGATDG